MKKTSLVWRLQNKLTLDDIEKMITLKIISSEEAKELTFNQSEDNEKIKALEEQVKFLKELVDKLSNQTTITTTPFVIWKYYQDYTPRYNNYWAKDTILCSTTVNNIKSMGLPSGQTYC